MPEEPRSAAMSPQPPVVAPVEEVGEDLDTTPWPARRIPLFPLRPRERTQAPQSPPLRVPGHARARCASRPAQGQRGTPPHPFSARHRTTPYPHSSAPMASSPTPQTPHCTQSTTSPSSPIKGHPRTRASTSPHRPPPHSPHTPCTAKRAEPLPRNLCCPGVSSKFRRRRRWDVDHGRAVLLSPPLFLALHSHRI